MLDPIGPDEARDILAEAAAAPDVPASAAADGSADAAAGPPVP